MEGLVPRLVVLNLPVKPKALVPVKTGLTAEELLHQREDHHIMHSNESWQRVTHGNESIVQMLRLCC